jgi:GDP-L-fucose synthase
METSARIFVAGHKGLIGSAIVRRLRREGVSDVLMQDRAHVDLRDARSVDAFFDEARPAYVVLAAGRVGGIVENQAYPADFINDNLAIQLNVLKAAERTGVRKLIFFGSSCMYPRDCPQPMAEDVLLSARPEMTSLPYAISKLAGTYMCLAYNKQYGDKRFIPVIPNSAYGPNDNFDPESGHVLSALMSRFHRAKLAGAEKVTLWGSGSPRREFVHADDIADACLRLLRQDVSALELPVNIGVGADVSIKDLAEMIAGVVGYAGRLEWDRTKPDGAPRKLLDSDRLRAFGWEPRVSFDEGLRNTYEWYVRNAMNTREPFGVSSS